MYRAAVAAGFYTDDVPGVASTVAADEAEDDAHQLADDVPKGGPTDTATSDPTAR